MTGGVTTDDPFALYEELVAGFGAVARGSRIRDLVPFRAALADAGRVVVSGLTYPEPGGGQAVVPESDPIIEALIARGAIGPGSGERTVVHLTRPGSAAGLPLPAAADAGSRRLFTQVSLMVQPTGVDPATQVVGVPLEPGEARATLAEIADRDVLIVDAGMFTEEEMWRLIPEGRRPVIIRISQADADRLGEAREIDALIAEAESQPGRAVSVHAVEGSSDYKAAVLTAA